MWLFGIVDLVTAYMAGFEFEISPIHIVTRSSTILSIVKIGTLIIITIGVMKMKERSDFTHFVIILLLIYLILGSGFGVYLNLRSVNYQKELRVQREKLEAEGMKLGLEGARLKVEGNIQEAETKLEEAEKKMREAEKKKMPTREKAGVTDKQLLQVYDRYMFQFFYLPVAITLLSFFLYQKTRGEFVPEFIKTKKVFDKIRCKK